ncbi:Avirulence protein (Avh) [Phytophthora palmivora]|uniref:RxLR effector protein n=1 Tax=Phytophthora palmivora TaxID=4796 RepID=A0A2P4YJ33_9STRA|nr:Avirulence protein (Avh) [Phytophthora palmivora]
MRMDIAVLLVLCAILAGINATSEHEQDTSPKNFIPTLSLIDTTTTKRFLRTTKSQAANFADTGDSSNNEERVNVQGVSKLADLDKTTWKLRKFDMYLSNKGWVKMGKDPLWLFKYFHLDRAGEKIDEKKRIIQWFWFATEYRATKGIRWLPDYEIHSILGQSGASEAKLAVLFESLRDIPRVKALAETMQKYQFQLWKDQGHNPTTVAKLLGIPNRGPLKTEFDSRYKILESFTKAYTGDAGTKLKRSTTIS